MGHTYSVTSDRGGCRRHVPPGAVLPALRGQKSEGGYRGWGRALEQTWLV